MLTVSYDHEPPWDLYLTLYPQAPGTSSQSNVAEAQPVVELKFVGIAQGVNVLNTSNADHADTELLSLVHAVLTCHSYVDAWVNPYLFLYVKGTFVNSCHDVVPTSLTLTS